MSFKDLIVPKWKHSRVEVRLTAIDTICNDVNILREIAETDSSPHVRSAAIKKIDDEPLLEIITKSEKDEQVLATAKKQRESILKRIIATSRDQQAVIVALEKFDVEKVTTAYLCENSCDISVQRTLIKQIKSHHLQSKITEHECAFEIAQQIVEQISEKEYLQKIARRASNKKIRTLAQEKIDALFADPLVREREIAKRLKQCCNGMDIEVSPKNYSQAVTLLEVSRSLWNKYDPGRCHPLAETYAAAEQRLVDSIKQADTQKNRLEMLEQLCSQAEQIINQPVDALMQQLEQLQAQWNAVDRTIIQEIPTGSLDDRFKTACAQIRLTIQTSVEALDQLRIGEESIDRACGELELFVANSASPDDRTWRRLLAHWETVSATHAPGKAHTIRIADVKKKYQDKIDEIKKMERNERQREIEKVERLVAEMATLAQVEPELTGSRYQRVVRLKQEWDSTRPLCSERKAELQGVFITAYENFMSVYHESRELSSWGQWAGVNVKKKLLDEIEQLESRIEHGESPNKIARKISLFDNRWKQAAGGNGGTPEIDNRFSVIREHLFSMAIAKKNELLETLKTILASSVDGNRSEEVKTVQKQWNDIGYLPPELEKDLPDLFYGLCNTFFEQRKEQYHKYSEELRENSALREEICIDAAKLSESSEWKATRDAFARLQQRWDESWPAPHKRSRELWLQFSRCRDLFFEHYHAFQSENDKVKEELCKNAERLLAELGEGTMLVHDERNEPEAATTQPVGLKDGVTEVGSKTVNSENDHDAGCSENINAPQVNYGLVFNDAVKLRKSWKESGPASLERSQELWEGFDSTLKKVFSIIDEEYRKNFDRKEALVKEAEAIALSEEWDSTFARFQEIRAEWKSIRPAARRDEQALWNRLQEAGNTFFEHRRTYFESRKNSIQEKLIAKEVLIAELEFMAYIAGKSQLLKTSRNQSAAEILKKGIELRNQFVVDGDPEKTYNNIKKRALEIIAIWEQGEQLHGREFYRLEQRFDELLGILKRR